MALAAAQAVEELAGLEVELKWPNDLLLAGRKLAGVLVETQVTGDRVTAAVLSAGINVNVAAEDFPETVRGTAVSLKEVTGREFPLEALAARVLDNLASSTRQQKEDLAREWTVRDHLKGRYVHLLAGSGHLDGVCHGVDKDGALLLDRRRRGNANHRGRDRSPKAPRVTRPFPIP